ncbi:hypothetical protein ACFFX0_29470 [Citricoccus parietis]|uniref:Uncharacterized protein n=1 Tax=Citricoccus parietis TaxID=592307 RepID=A0ABV5FXY7_9MICC
MDFWGGIYGSATSPGRVRTSVPFTSVMASIWLMRPRPLTVLTGSFTWRESTVAPLKRSLRGIA